MGRASLGGSFSPMPVSGGQKKVYVRMWVLAAAKNASDEESERREAGTLLSLQDCNENSCEKEKALQCP